MIRGMILSALLFATVAQASELDRDMSNIQNPELEGTVVLRVNAVTGAKEILKSEEVVGSEQQAINLARKNEAKFAPLAAEKMRAELDAETGSSSWYFYNNAYGCAYGYCNNWYNSSYYNYSYYPYYCNNYGYTPYYGYYNGNYSYYYYGRYSRWW